MKSRRRGKPRRRSYRSKGMGKANTAQRKMRSRMIGDRF